MKLNHTLVLGTVVHLATALFTTSPAKAEAFCTSGDGWSGCAVPGLRYDEVTFTYTGGREDFKIRCSATEGWEYESTGTLTKAEATQFVESYCDSRGYGHR